MNKKGRFPSEAAMAIGLLAIGGYALYRGASSSSSDSQGSIGGSDVPSDENYPLVSDSDTDGTRTASTIAPVSYYPESEVGSAVENAPILAADMNPASFIASSPSGSTKSAAEGDIPLTSQSQPIGAGGWLLGAAGLTGSYFTSAGETILKNYDGFLKSVYTTGIESIPVVGKKAAKYLEIGGESIAKDGVKTVSQEVTQSTGKTLLKSAEKQILETGVESGGKALLKKTAKLGISLVPFAGTAAGAEFDVRYSGKGRVEAYVANAAGDILGGILGAAGAIFGGVGGVAGGIGGQIAGEQAVYKGGELVSQGYESIKSVPTLLDMFKKTSELKKEVDARTAGTASLASVTVSRIPDVPQEALPAAEKKTITGSQGRIVNAVPAVSGSAYAGISSPSVLSAVKAYEAARTKQSSTSTSKTSSPVKASAPTTNYASSKTAIGTVLKSGWTVTKIKKKK